MGMSTFNNHNFHSKILVLTLMSLTLLTIVNGSYLGLRYGKREYDGESLGRLVPRSENAGIRRIQVRSSGARFYPGTRFGGKRSYWQPTPMLSEFDERTSAGSSSGGSGSLHDCFYVPQVGVRCSRPEDSNYLPRSGNDILIDAANNGDGDVLSDNNANPLSMSSASSAGGVKTLSGTRIIES